MPVGLDDKYTCDEGRVFLTGAQALVRLPLMQQKRDRAAGLHTAGFISGYRGSPLGMYDQQLWRAQAHLAAHDIHFQPGLNEELAATAVWGSQQTNLFAGARYDGVFGLWYGKAPGVDRAGDALRHANLAGTAAHGGVLVVAGDDHGCKSSTLPSQSEYAFMDLMMPVLNPAGVQDLLDYGLYGWAMSRYSGCWVALVALAETLDSSAVVDAGLERARILIPDDFELPPGGVNIRLGDAPLAQEERQHRYKMYAALAFARANRLNRVMIDSPRPRLGIVTTGKAYLDVRQALDDLGITPEMAGDMGLRLMKVGMSWPLDRSDMRAFAEGLEEILVIEEKRALIENQLKEQLYNWPVASRPRVVGKFDEAHNWLLPSMGELTPAQIARVLVARLPDSLRTARMTERLAHIDAREAALKKAVAKTTRTPWFCSGCPHNTSTRLPDGSRGLAGIGCHYMVTWMDRSTPLVSQMGGEGAAWIGQAPFTTERHVFANLGDGTYCHSGLMAIRAAVAAGVNITYKILFNDAVAMTGGQPFDGPLSVPQISRQLAAEGIERIVVVSDQPEKYHTAQGLAPGVAIEHRDRLDQVQRDLRETPGVSVIIYDQTCAAEKRRRRKRGLYPDPARRVFINERVCEGCGDCSEKSNCVSVEPLETEFGRKRVINQSSCNKDFSCVKGFCPSFVSVIGGRLRKTSALDADFPELPAPELPALDRPFNIAITGIGGTGVVTIGALLGMAAHIEGRGATVLDMIGLAQKGGAVLSFVRIARSPDDIHAPRVAAGAADTLLACDLVVAAGADALAKVSRRATRAVVNADIAPTADFIRDKDIVYDAEALIGIVRDNTGALNTVPATRLASALLGDAIAANIFMLGYAWQNGLIPLGAPAIEAAIELNGVAVRANKRAFAWGRRAAVDYAAVAALAGLDETPQAPPSLEERIALRAGELTAYQDAGLARRYRDRLAEVAAREHEVMPGEDRLQQAVAVNYFKLLAYKDEYEVARLYADGRFEKRLREQFEGDFTLRYHMAPPLWTKTDPASGEPLKRTFGPWMGYALRLLARLKGLRGTWLDPFDHAAERRLITHYEKTLDILLAGLNADNYALAVEIATLPAQIRGYGPVREKSQRAVLAREADLLRDFQRPRQTASDAAALNTAA
jgi:indolepyruvate ferredoxin oxidoreductase